MNSTGLAVAIVGSLISLVGILIVLNLRSIKKCISSLFTRVDKQDNRIEQCKDNISNCKTDFERRFISNETFLRETGFTRRTLENVSASVNRVEGKLTVVEKLPKICGDISREIVKEMKNGEKK